MSRSIFYFPRDTCFAQHTPQACRAHTCTGLPAAILLSLPAHHHLHFHLSICLFKVPDFNLLAGCFQLIAWLKQNRELWNNPSSLAKCFREIDLFQGRSLHLFNKYSLRCPRSSCVTPLPSLQGPERNTSYRGQRFARPSATGCRAPPLRDTWDGCGNLQVLAHLRPHCIQIRPGIALFVPVFPKVWSLNPRFQNHRVFS